MNKLYKIILAMILILTTTFTFNVSAEVSAPVIELTGASIKIPDEDNTDNEIRFKVKVHTSLADGITVAEQGAIIIPLSENDTNSFSYGDDGVVRRLHEDVQYYSQGEDFYEFTTVYGKVIARDLRSKFCVRGYMIYKEAGSEEELIAYSDIKLYDIYSVAKEVMESEKENDATKEAVDMYTIEEYDAYASSAGTAGLSQLVITAPSKGSTVYPYFERAKNYLLAYENLSGTVSYGYGADNYIDARTYGYDFSVDSAVPVEVKWGCGLSNVESFTISYATKSDFSDEKVLYAPESARSINIYNLYKATDYYLKVTANLTNGSSYATTSAFKTTDMGPRVMYLEGSKNIRDLGGYETSSGKRTLQGLIYRGGQLDGEFKSGTDRVHSTALTDFGKHTASKELGIKTELDFRGINPPAIPDVNYIHIPSGGYNLADAECQELMRRIFATFANINNYPMIFHCQGGADRTGAVSYLFNALLGVSEKDIIRDYEFTSFSCYLLREIDETAYINNPSYQFFTTIAAQQGTTLQEKVENYLLSIGVTAKEIANIKSIMFTGVAERGVVAPEEFKLAEESELKVSILGRLDDVTKVYIGANEVDFATDNSGYVVVRASEFATKISDGAVTVRVVFKDGGEYTDSFNYDSTRNITACESVSKSTGNPLTVTVGALPEDIAEVYVGGHKVEYTCTGNVITVECSKIPSAVVSGEVQVKVVFKDGGESTDTFEYDASVLIMLEDLIEQTTLVYPDNTQITSPNIGYGNWARMRLEATSGIHGDLSVYMGSYGARFRGGSTRFLWRDADGNYLGEARPSGTNMSQGHFGTGNSHYLDIRVDLISDTQYKLSLRLINAATGGFVCEQSYTGTRVGSNEMAQALVSVVIGSDTPQCVVYGSSSSASLLGIVEVEDTAAQAGLLAIASDTVRLGVGINRDTLLATATAKIYKTDSDIEGYLILAEYDGNGKLINVDLENIDTTEQAAGTTQVYTANIYITTGIVKAIALDTKATPLASYATTDELSWTNWYK